MLNQPSKLKACVPRSEMLFFRLLNAGAYTPKAGTAWRCHACGAPVGVMLSWALFFPVFHSFFPLPRKHGVQQAHTSLYKRRDQLTLCGIVPRQKMLTESGCVSPCKVVIMAGKRRWDYKTEQLVYKARTQKATSPGLMVSPRHQSALWHGAGSHSTGDTNRLKA